MLTCGVLSLSINTAYTAQCHGVLQNDGTCFNTYKVDDAIAMGVHTDRFQIPYIT